MPPAPELVIGARPVNAYCRWIAKGIPFAFSRWGDGEWRAVLGHSGANTDRQPYTPALQADLVRVLEDRPPYLLGLQPLAVRLLGAEIAAWLRARAFWPPWDNADVWHRASKTGELGLLIKALRGRRVLVVGPRRLRKLAGRLPIAVFVEIPDREAHTALATMRADLARGLDALGSGGVVVLSAGMSANVLLHDYCAATPRATAPPRTTWIDCGAVWEPYVGHANRTYHAAVLERLAAARERACR